MPEAWLTHDRNGGSISSKYSVKWYVDVFGFQTIWEEADSANLKMKQGPLLFLKKSEIEQPIKFIVNEQESPVISFKTNDLEKFHQVLKLKGYDIEEITEYGNGTNGPYKDFLIRDPDGNLIEINSYPDIHLEKFRGNY